MNSILTGNSNNLEKTATTKPHKDVETAGSLAMNFDPLFSIPSNGGYDMFVPSNPFSLNINCGFVNIAPDAGLAEHNSYIQNLNVAMNFAQTSTETGFSSAPASVGGGFSAGSCASSGGFLC